MRSALLPLLTVTLLACRGPIASGQYPYAWPGYYGGYGATPGESYAMGMSALVSSAGMATLSTSTAASNFQDALSKGLDNHVKFTQAYAERQRLVQANRDAIQANRAAKRKPPPTAEQLYRWSQQAKPKPLSASELDPVSGKISWPAVLRDDAFESYRRSTQNFFHDAVAKPESFSYGSYQQLQQTTGECLSELKSRINDYQANDYIHAKNFVERLAYAAQQF